MRTQVELRISMHITSYMVIMQTLKKGSRDGSHTQGVRHTQALILLRENVNGDTAPSQL